MNASPTATLPWGMRVVLFALAAASVATYAFAVFTPDTARDLEAAMRILAGEAFPTQGALIGGTLRLGPLWFYVLAALLAPTRSLAGVSLAVGVLAATKYLFAYLTGRTLGGPRTGFFVALAVAIPGAAALDGFTWSHVNLVAATSWLTLWCAALAARHDDQRLVLVTGGALALALHAHPTAIVLAPVLVSQMVATRRVDGGALAALAGAALIAALPIALAWLAAGDTPIAADIARHARQSGAGGMREIAAAMASGIAEFAYGAFLHRDAVPSTFELVAQRAIWAVAALGVAWRIATRAPLAWTAIASIALAAAGLAVVAALRPFTPYYMAVAAWSGAVLAAGLGLDALAAGPRPLRVLAAAAAVAIVGLQFALAGGTIVRAREGWLHTPLNAVSDLKTMHRDVRDEPIVPALTRDALARALCDTTARISLHGEFATALDLSFAQETALACDSRARALLGGADAGREHWVGLPMYAARKLALVPERSIGSYAVFTPERIVGPGSAHAVADGDHYPPHDFASMPLRPLHLAWRAPADRAVLLTNPLPWYLPVREVTLRRDGVVQVPRFTSSSLTGWRCDGCGDTDAAWTLELRTADPSWIDVVTLR